MAKSTRPTILNVVLTVIIGDVVSKIIFVYGTLKRGHGNNALLTDSEFLGEAEIEGFEIFHLGWFPGVKRGKGVVYGELYSISDAVLERVDCLEGYNHSNPEHGLYNRVQTTALQVIEGGGYAVSCMVYIYNGKPTETLPDGRWE